jgi:hypothetical protein
MRHWRILLVVTALRAVTTEAPQWRYRQQGRIPEEPKPAPLSAPRSDALFAPEVHFFLRRKFWKAVPASAWHDGSTSTAMVKEI